MSAAGHHAYASPVEEGLMGLIAPVDNLVVTIYQARRRWHGFRRSDLKVEWRYPIESSTGATIIFSKVILHATVAPSDKYLEFSLSLSRSGYEK